MENNKEEMTNLIQDLMKLDLHKFSNKSPQNEAAFACKNSPNTSSNNISQYQKRRNSADQVIVIEAGSAPFAQQSNSPSNNYNSTR